MTEHAPVAIKTIDEVHLAPLGSLLPSSMTDGSFNFLGLPKDVRLIIYTITIKHEYSQRFWYLDQSAETTGIWLYFRDRSPVPQPSLSKVNKQMRTEALDVFWAMPRICYPYIKQLPIPDLQALRNGPEVRCRLAPRGVTALRQFSMYWNFFREASRLGFIMDSAVAIVAKVIFRSGEFPAADIILKSSDKTEHRSYNDNFMLDVLHGIGISAPIRLREPRRDSGRRWTYAQFEVDDAMKLLQRLHWVLNKHDKGPSYTTDSEEGDVHYWERRLEGSDG